MQEDFFNPENNIQRFMLENGLRVFVIPNPMVQFVESRLIIEAGSADDPKGKIGLAHYTEHLVSETAEHEHGDLEDYFTSTLLGEYYVPSVGLRNTKFGFSVYKKKWPEAMQLTLNEALNYGLGNTKASYRKHNKIILREYAESYSNKNVDKHVLSVYDYLLSDTPFSHPSTILGVPATIKHITMEDIIEFYETYYHYSNAFVVLYGNVTLEEAKDVFSTVTMKARISRELKRELFYLNGIHDTRFRTVTKPSLFSGEVDSKIQIVTFGNNHPLSYYLEWVLESWLHEVVREKEKLIYSTEINEVDLFTLNGKIFSIQSSKDKKGMEKLVEKFTDLIHNPLSLEEYFTKARSHSLVQFYLMEYDAGDYINYIVDRYSKQAIKFPKLPELYKMEEEFSFKEDFIPLWKSYFGKRAQITLFEKY